MKPYGADEFPIDDADNSSLREPLKEESGDSLLDQFRECNADLVESKREVEELLDWDEPQESLREDSSSRQPSQAPTYGEQEQNEEGHSPVFKRDLAPHHPLPIGIEVWENGSAGRPFEITNCWQDENGTWLYDLEGKGIGDYEAGDYGSYNLSEIDFNAMFHVAN